MKKNIIPFIVLWFCNTINAQYFKSDISSTIRSNEGGQISLTNPSKTGKNANTWTLFNMTGVYGNGLNFWAYAADGTNLGPKMTLSDDGNLGINSGSISSTLRSNEGGQFNLNNPNKTGKNAATWTLFNMTGVYGNGLNFWAYAADGTNLGPKMTLSDDGNLGVNSGGISANGNIFARNGSFYASLNSNEGPFLSLINPKKNTNGTATDWRIYNMTGGYGNSLQFWAYDNIGCTSGGLCNSKLTIMDNGNVGIGTNPSYKLDVDGTSASKIVRASNSGVLGGYMEIANTDKTTNGTANTWRIYNMTGGYGNSLQFWAYDNIGCTSGGLCNSKLTIMDNGNVGIGNTNPVAKLTVEGNILASSIKVAVPGSANWSDYVFAKEYQLQPLEEVEAFIKKNQHLPNVPSAAEMVKEGNDLGKTDAKLLEKIEELTLYIIEMKKENGEMKKIMESQNNKIQLLETKINH